MRIAALDYDAPIVRALGNSAYGAYVRLVLYATAHRTDGWMAQEKTREIATRAELRRLLTTRTLDHPVLLHGPGDACPCLTGIDWPITRGGYWLHGFRSAGL